MDDATLTDNNGRRRTPPCRADHDEERRFARPSATIGSRRPPATRTDNATSPRRGDAVARASRDVHAGVPQPARRHRHVQPSSPTVMETIVCQVHPAARGAARRTAHRLHAGCPRRDVAGAKGFDPVYGARLLARVVQRRGAGSADRRDPVRKARTGGTVTIGAGRGDRHAHLLGMDPLTREGLTSADQSLARARPCGRAAGPSGLALAPLTASRSAPAITGVRPSARDLIVASRCHPPASCGARSVRCRRQREPAGAIGLEVEARCHPPARVHAAVPPRTQVPTASSPAPERNGDGGRPATGGRRRAPTHRPAQPDHQDDGARPRTGARDEPRDRTSGRNLRRAKRDRSTNRSSRHGGGAAGRPGSAG